MNSHKHFRIIRITLPLLLFAVAACNNAFGFERDRTIRQYVHASWSAKEGAPGNIRAITQSSEGYLWLGATDGLFRFDGGRFEHFEQYGGTTLPAGPVTALLGLPNGDLWIGYYSGAVARLRNGRAEIYTEREGFPGGHLWCFAQDRHGAVWAGTGSALARFDNNRWREVGKEWNFSGKSAKALFVDDKGALWVATDDTLLLLPEGSSAFQSTSVHIGQVLQIAEAHNGTLWMAETSRSVRPIPLTNALTPSAETEIRVGSKAILFDEDDSLWIATLGDGMRRVSAPEQLQGKPGRFSHAIESYMSRDGLSNDMAVSMFEDRDRNIWVGTFRGLDRFHRSSLIPINFSVPEPGPVLIPGNRGDVWAFLSGSTFHIDKLHVDKVTDLIYPVDGGFLDTKGVMWLITRGNLIRFENGHFYFLPLPKELPVPFTNYLNIARDGSDVLWLAAEQVGLFYRESGRWSRIDIPHDVARLVPISAFTDESGRPWFGYAGAVVLTLVGKQVQIIHLKPGHPLDGVTAIDGRRRHLWFGTDTGVVFFESDQFHEMTPVDQPEFLHISGLRESADGSLWLCEKRGIIHINAPEVRRFLEMPSYRVRYEIFDSLDGLPGTFEGNRQKLAEATDGVLWFGADRGVAWLNPATIPANVPPPVAVDSVTAADKQFLVRPDLTLPPRSDNLQIEYTAVNLSVPERVRYRYRLDSVDVDWRDAGARREAFYTNLSPGRYTFHITARNEGGQWNANEAVVDFRIAPAWFQTIWFRAFCVCIFLILLWMLYQLRLRQLERQFNRTLEARVGERTRIARELHDTLLQTFSASLLRFQSVSRMLPGRPEEAKQRVESVMEQASNAIAEGRAAVHQLRSSGLTTADFAQSISNFASELIASSAAGNPPEFWVHVEGTPRNLNPTVRDEAYRIAAEALRNAVQHAGARQIEVEVRYDEQQLRLRLRDDGQGIDPRILEQGHAPGHWGLRGMRERAKLLGGNFEVWSQVGSGTEVELTVPAASAYAKPASRWPTFWRK